MRRILELDSELSVAPHRVSAVKYLDDDSSMVYLLGAEPGGLKVEVPLDELVDTINESLHEDAIDRATLSGMPSDILGERSTGYEGGDGRGPFECGNCRYFQARDSSCGQKVMMLASQQPRTRDGRVRVDAHGCCEFVARNGAEEA